MHGPYISVAPTFSVVVMNWNGKQFLDTCLSALRNQRFKDFETIFVDNGSDDGSANFVREAFPEVRVVALEQNIGFAAGNIAGYKVATGDWIVLLNNDTEADAGWLEALRDAIQNFPAAGTFACKMLFFDERTTIDNCGFDLAAAGTTADLGRGEEDTAEWSSPRCVFGGCGGAVAYRRSMLEGIGFFDPDYFMTFEDLDLSFRAQLQGYECIFVPGAVVYHRYRGTMTKYPARQVYFSQRNIEFAYLKNMPLALILRYLPQRILHELGAAIYFTRLGVGGAFFKAKFDAVRQLPTLLRKRHEIQKRRTISNAQLRSRMRANRLGAKWTKFCSAWRSSADGSVQKSLGAADQS
jgi:GT2 family glycosyltransferase